MSTLPYTSDTVLNIGAETPACLGAPQGVTNWHQTAPFTVTANAVPFELDHGSGNIASIYNGAFYPPSGVSMAPTITSATVPHTVSAIYSSGTSALFDYSTVAGGAGYVDSAIPDRLWTGGSFIPTRPAPEDNPSIIGFSRNDLQHKFPSSTTQAYMRGYGSSSQTQVPPPLDYHGLYTSSGQMLPTTTLEPPQLIHIDECKDWMTSAKLASQHNQLGAHQSFLPTNPLVNSRYVWDQTSAAHDMSHMTNLMDGGHLSMPTQPHNNTGLILPTGLLRSRPGRHSTRSGLVPTLECPLCKKRYCRKSTLRSHMKQHSGQRPHACHYCDKTFTQAANLTAHQRIHTGEKPYSCNICGRPFSQSSSLATHRRTHTGEKPYPCAHCTKRFADSSTLAKHVRTHTGSKPYQCSICAQRFSQSGNLHRHIKTHREYK